MTFHVIIQLYKPISSIFEIMISKYVVTAYFRFMVNNIYASNYGITLSNRKFCCTQIFARTKQARRPVSPVTLIMETDVM